MKKMVAVLFFVIVSMTACNANVSEVNIDSNWEELEKVYPEAPLAINAETGEPISDEPAGPWDGPAD